MNSTPVTPNNTPNESPNQNVITYQVPNDKLFSTLKRIAPNRVKTIKSINEKNEKKSRKTMSRTEAEEYRSTAFPVKQNWYIRYYFQSSNETDIYIIETENRHWRISN